MSAGRQLRRSASPGGRRSTSGTTSPQRLPTQSTRSPHESAPRRSAHLEAEQHRAHIGTQNSLLCRGMDSARTGVALLGREPIIRPTIAFVARSDPEWTTATATLRAPASGGSPWARTIAPSARRARPPPGEYEGRWLRRHETCNAGGAAIGARVVATGRCQERSSVPTRARDRVGDRAEASSRRSDRVSRPSYPRAERGTLLDGSIDPCRVAKVGPPERQINVARIGTHALLMPDLAPSPPARHDNAGWSAPPARTPAIGSSERTRSPSLNRPSPMPVAVT